MHLCRSKWLLCILRQEFDSAHLNQSHEKRNNNNKTNKQTNKTTTTNINLPKFRMLQSCCYNLSHQADYPSVENAVTMWKYPQEWSIIGEGTPRMKFQLHVIINKNSKEEKYWGLCFKKFVIYFKKQTLQSYMRNQECTKIQQPESKPYNLIFFMFIGFPAILWLVKRFCS